MDEREWETDFDHSCNPHPVCPYCGFEDHDPEMGHNDESERECHKCGKDILIERVIDVTYTTYKPKQAEGTTND